MNEQKWIRVEWFIRVVIWVLCAVYECVCELTRNTRASINGRSESGQHHCESHELHNALANILFVNCDFNVTAGRIFTVDQISFVAQQCVEFMISLTRQKCTNAKHTRNGRKERVLLINYRFIIFQTVVILANTQSRQPCLCWLCARFIHSPVHRHAQIPNLVVQQTAQIVAKNVTAILFFFASCWSRYMSNNQCLIHREEQEGEKLNPENRQRIKVQWERQQQQQKPREKKHNSGSDSISKSGNDSKQIVHCRNICELCSASYHGKYV